MKCSDLHPKQVARQRGAPPLVVVLSDGHPSRARSRCEAFRREGRSPAFDSSCNEATPPARNSAGHRNAPSGQRRLFEGLTQRRSAPACPVRRHLTFQAPRPSSRVRTSLDVGPVRAWRVRVRGTTEVSSQDQTSCALGHIGVSHDTAGIDGSMSRHIRDDRSQRPSGGQPNNYLGR